jgi:Methyl-accepting chemotaxis protein
MSKLGKKLMLISLIICAIAAINLLSAFYLAFNKTENTQRDIVRENITKAAQVIDSEKLNKIVKSKDNTLPEHTELLNSMLLFNGRSDIKNFYVLMKQDDSSALFLLDASAEPADFLEKYELDSSMDEAFKGNVVVDTEITTDEWGDSISAYAPVKNSSGEVIAIAGVDADVTLIQSMKNNLIVSVIIAFVVFLALFAVTILLFSLRLKKNIKAINNNLNEVNHGDLSSSISIRSKDEIEDISKFINEFKDRINDILKLFRNNIKNISGQSGQLSISSEHMSSSFQEAASSIENVTEGVSAQSNDLSNINDILNRFGQDLQKIADSIKGIDISSNEIKQMTSSSSSDMQQLRNSMIYIEEKFQDFVVKIKKVENDTSRINEITNAINEVASRTNLLALNASIEAARAGESGRGFAVVAEEIRKLAEQSKVSSDTISALLLI